MKRTTKFLIIPLIATLFLFGCSKKGSEMEGDPRGNPPSGQNINDTSVKGVSLNYDSYSMYKLGRLFGEQIKEAL